MHFYSLQTCAGALKANRRHTVSVKGVGVHAADVVVETLEE